MDAQDGGPPPVRTRDHPMGIPDVAPSHARELHQANELVRRTAALLRAARDSGAEYILEHPADRGAYESPIFLHKDHAPISIMPEIVALRRTDDAASITFPQ
eukprot:3848429-Pleurochrysis_carterae.AAC.1